MSMIKVIPGGSWDFGVEPTAMMKVASSGFSGEDRREFLQKRAGDGMFADMVTKVAMGPGDIPIHTIAIGATEVTGPNRNADGFTVNTCRKHASSFVSRPLRDYVKHAHNGARYFLHHKNDDPLKSYGYVKAAAYNENMGRIELLILANGTKEAAQRNGGMVLPDEIQDKLHNGTFVGGSMSCKIAHDVCQICFNKAASRKDYCSEDTCVGPDGLPGFGCKSGLARLLKSGRMQFVDNPDPIFFDFSYVNRPADRTAYGGMSDDFRYKAASAMIPGGAWIAEQYGLFSDGLMYTTHQDDFHIKQLKLARDLAYLEAEMDTSPRPEDFISKAAFHKLVQPELDLSSLGQPLTRKFAAGLRALAEAETFLTPEDFLAIASPGISGENIKIAAEKMREKLPRAFRKLSANENLSTLLDHAFSPDVTGVPSSDQRRLAVKASNSRSYCICQLSKRASLAILRGADVSQIEPMITIIKKAESSKPDASNTESSELAEKYALYQLATLAASGKEHTALTLRAVLVHNRC